MSGLSSPLFAGSFSLLLLLNTGSDGLVWRRIFQVHGRHKRTRELLLSDEGVQLGLLRRPALERVDCEQTPYKVDECYPVVELYDNGKLDNKLTQPH